MRNKKHGCERIPGDPVEGDLVIINAMVEYFSEERNIVLIWRLNGVCQKPRTANHISVAENESVYYSFELGRFKESDTIIYYLQIEGDEDLKLTKEFGFCVLMKYRFDEIFELEFKNDLLVFNFREQGVHKSRILERSEINYTSEEKMKIAQRKNGYYLELIGKITPEDLFPGVMKLLKRIKADGVGIA